MRLIIGVGDIIEFTNTTTQEKMSCKVIQMICFRIIPLKNYTECEELGGLITI